jgi:hypothetical protein
MWLCEISDIVDVLALGKPQISLVLRVRNMLEIVLGVLVGDWCLRLLVRCHGFLEQGIEQNRKTLIRAFLLPYSD